MNPNIIETSLKQNIEWFFNSGVIADNGRWGVAERVICPDNQAIDKVLSAFPYFTKYSDAYVLEHRRPDCNFQTAWLFDRAADIPGCHELRQTAFNIIEYLYSRSGMLNKSYPQLPAAAWEWSTNNLENQFYFDDNGWNCLIALMLADLYPELDGKYMLKQNALILAGTLADGLDDQFFRQSGVRRLWGKPELPHWGSLACMAIAGAFNRSPVEKWRDIVTKYHEYMLKNHAAFNTSEQAYMLLGASLCAKVFNLPVILAVVEKSAKVLLDKMDMQTGNIASEHYETRNGPELADTVYTINWSLMAFHLAYSLTGSKSYKMAQDRQIELFVKIQDKTDSPHYNGCWRGLYDFASQSWNGGDLHEGGSGSVYTGWTNAPVSMVLTHCLRQDSLLDYI